MDVPPDETAAKRRKVRKGTHSCWECRRRKVKCIYASPDDVVCVTCDRRGAQCVSQWKQNNVVHRGFQDDLDDWTVEKKSSEVQPEKRNDSFCYTPLTRASTTPTSDLTLGEASKTGCSSNQSLTPSFLPTPAPDHTSITEETNHSKIIQTLLQALPCQKDIEILLSKTSKISALAYQSNFKSYVAGTKAMPVEQIPLANLLRPERHPVLLGRQMLLFAASIQNLPQNEVFSGLTEKHRDIMERLAELAIRFVTANDALLSTLENLENIILEGFYHLDSGNIRRAWVTMRRAVTAAQLLGLHRPGQYRYKLINGQNKLDPEVTWTCVVAMERTLSLLLGLPTSTSGTRFTAGTRLPDLATLITESTAKVIERNQISERQRYIEMTKEIDQELVKGTEQLPSLIWRPLAFAGLQVDSAEALWESRRAWEQMCYFMLVNQLHLPYMLCQDNASHAIYSRMACVNASRETLNREVTLRTFNPINACYRMGDFMSLVAGMTLILAHIVSHCSQDNNNLLAHQRLGDRATVERALECMTNMSEMRQDVLAAKCATLLENLLTIESQAAQGRICRIQRQNWPNEGVDGNNDIMIIKIPYIGAVKFVLERDSSMMAPSEPHGGGCAVESVTIGGLGSVQFRNHKPHPQETSDGISGSAAHQMGIPIQQDKRRLASVTYLDSLTDQDQMFPDAAARMDDWVLQGFDTAFFDALFSGTRENEPNGNRDETWHFSDTST